MLSGAVISLVIALLTTNNLGGEAVGFRHAVYLGPVFIVLLLPWLVGPAKLRGLVIGVGAASVLLMLVFAVREPWSVLTWSNARVGTWHDYLPLADRIVHATLFTP